MELFILLPPFYRYNIQITSSVVHIRASMPTHHTPQNPLPRLQGYQNTAAGYGLCQALPQWCETMSYVAVHPTSPPKATSLVTGTADRTCVCTLMLSGEKPTPGVKSLSSTESVKGLEIPTEGLEAITC